MIITANLPPCSNWGLGPTYTYLLLQHSTVLFVAYEWDSFTPLLVQIRDTHVQAVSEQSPCVQQGESSENHLSLPGRCAREHLRYPRLFCLQSPYLDLSVCLSVCLPVYIIYMLSPFVSVCLLTLLSIIYLLSTHVSVYMSFSQYIYLYVYLLA